MLESSRPTGSDEAAVAHNERAKQLALVDVFIRFKVEKDGNRGIKEIRRVVDAKFERYKLRVLSEAFNLYKKLCGNFVSVKLFKAARLRIQIEQNEARIGEDQHDERRRDGERISYEVFRQLVCFRFWRVCAVNVATAVSVWRRRRSGNLRFLAPVEIN